MILRLEILQKVMTKNDGSLCHISITIRDDKLINMASSLADPDCNHLLGKCLKDFLEPNVSSDSFIGIRAIGRKVFGSEATYTIFDSLKGFFKINEEWQLNPEAKARRYYT